MSRLITRPVQRINEHRWTCIPRGVSRREGEGGDFEESSTIVRWRLRSTFQNNATDIELGIELQDPEDTPVFERPHDGVTWLNQEAEESSRV